VSSCEIATPPPLPPAPAMPETYIGGTDTLTDGTIQWRDFFSDTVLVGLIETALANNYDLLTAIQRVEMARANYRIRSGALFPSLNAAATADLGSVNDNLVREGAQDENMPRFQEEYFFGLQASWEADIWGRLRNE